METKNSSQEPARDGPQLKARPQDEVPSPSATSAISTDAIATVPGSAGPPLMSKTPAPLGPAQRWWSAVAVAMVVSLPLAWLLSYAAALMFYVGLFFFALFGLVIGASAYRVASVAMPYSRRMILVGTTILVLVPWVSSIVKESRDLPGDIAGRAIEAPRLKIGDRTPDQYRAEVRGQVREFIRQHYGFGGTLGYISWVVRSGEFKRGDLPAAVVPLGVGQRGAWWIVRAALSVALLAFGVASQTLLLCETGPVDPTPQPDSADD